MRPSRGRRDARRISNEVQNIMSAVDLDHLDDPDSDNVEDDEMEDDD